MHILQRGIYLILGITIGSTITYSYLSKYSLSFEHVLFAYEKGYVIGCIVENGNGCGNKAKQFRDDIEGLTKQLEKGNK